MDNNAYAATLVALLAIVFLVNKWLDYTTPNVCPVSGVLSLLQHLMMLQLSATPAIGSTGKLSSFLSAHRFVHNGHDMIQEGIRKYGPAAFRVPMADKWMVILSEKSQINDIRQAREDEISFYHAVGQVSVSTL